MDLLTLDLEVGEVYSKLEQTYFNNYVNRYVGMFIKTNVANPIAGYMFFKRKLNMKTWNIRKN